MNNILLKTNDGFVATKLKQAKDKLINKNYHEIYNHELAHKSAAGTLGGSIHINKNSAGIPVSGFVPITMPSLPQKPTAKGLQKTIDHAKTVIKAAMAPLKPSSADFAVKNSAEKTLNKAQSMRDNQNKHINYLA